MYMYVCVPYFSRENASFARENTPYVCTASVVSREFKQIRFYVLLNHQLLTAQHILGRVGYSTSCELPVCKDLKNISNVSEPR